MEWQISTRRPWNVKHLAVCLYFWFKKIHFLTLTTKLAYLSGRRLASVDIITRWDTNGGSAITLTVFPQLMYRSASMEHSSDVLLCIVCDCNICATGYCLCGTRKLACWHAVMMVVVTEWRASDSGHGADGKPHSLLTSNRSYDYGRWVPLYRMLPVHETSFNK